MMDSYLGDELLVETNHEVLHHLENCQDCRRELAARRELRTQMRSAVKNAPEAELNAVFAAGLKNNLRQTALHPTIWEKFKGGVLANRPIFAGALAACLLAAAIAFVWLYRFPANESLVADKQNQTNQPRESPRQTDSTAAQAVQIALRELGRSATGDHKNCAIRFQLAEKPITLSEATAKYGSFYRDLDKTIIAAVQKNAKKNKDSGKESAKIEVIEAHSCIFQGRRFAHIVLRRNNKIISLLVTDSDSFDGNDSTITNQTDEDMQVAGFGTARHAIFVVSDMSAAENSQIAEMLSPAVRLHLEKAKA